MLVADAPLRWAGVADQVGLLRVGAEPRLSLARGLEPHVLPRADCGVVTPRVLVQQVVDEGRVVRVPLLGVQSNEQLAVQLLRRAAGEGFISLSHALQRSGGRTYLLRVPEEVVARGPFPTENRLLGGEPPHIVGLAAPDVSGTRRVAPRERHVVVLHLSLVVVGVGHVRVALRGGMRRRNGDDADHEGQCGR